MAILRKQKITVSVYAVLPFPASIRGTSMDAYEALENKIMEKYDLKEPFIWT